MRQNATLILLCFLLVILVAGCGKPANPAVDPEELYEQIEPGMSVEEVYAIMDDCKVVSESETTVDTPLGPHKTDTVSWQINKHLIIVIFDNGTLLGKDITKL